MRTSKVESKHLKIFFFVGRKVKRSKSFKLFASQELLIGAILRKHFPKLENANLATYLKIADFYLEQTIFFVPFSTFFIHA
jgi:hypothetical protein